MQHSPHDPPGADGVGLDPAVGPSPASRVQSVDRAMLLLRAVAEADDAEATAARLAEACGLNRATAWRLLSTLESHGMVLSDRETGRWRVGAAVVEIARAAGVDAVVAAAHACLESLSEQSGETAALAVFRNGALTYVDEVTPRAVVAATWYGRTVPLHATSTGKVLLAFGDRGVVGRLTRPRLTRFTDTTLTSRAALVTELAATREQGFGCCRGEYEASAWGVSAPVRDSAGRVLAVVSIWGPASRVGEDRLIPLGRLVRRAADAILGS